MSENDYIAEYVKQKHPNILGIDFAIWKIAETFKNGIKAMGKIIQVTPKVDLEVEEVDPEDIEAAGDEEDEDPDDEMPEMQD